VQGRGASLCTQNAAGWCCARQPLWWAACGGAAPQLSLGGKLGGGGACVCTCVCTCVCVHVCLSACAACGHRQVLVATAADRPTDALQLWAALPVVLGLPRSAFPTRTRSYALQTGRRCAMQAPAGQSIPVRAACISAVLLRGVSWSLVQASPGRRRQRAQLTSESKPWQALPEIAACPGACSLLWSLMQAGGPGPD